MEFYKKATTGEGLAELYELVNTAELKTYHLLYAAIATFERRSGNETAAKSFFEKALLYAKTEPEKAFLLKRIREY
jgi:predicted RNA polymerase sigma factor